MTKKIPCCTACPAASWAGPAHVWQHPGTPASHPAPRKRRALQDHRQAASSRAVRVWGDQGLLSCAKTSWLYFCPNTGCFLSKRFLQLLRSSSPGHRTVWQQLCAPVACSHKHVCVPKVAPGTLAGLSMSCLVPPAITSAQPYWVMGCSAAPLLCFSPPLPVKPLVSCACLSSPLLQVQMPAR